MTTGGVIENQVSSGLSQFSGGANGLITSGMCIGAPATDANVYAAGCTLYQRDSSTNYNTIVWQNTGTAAVPVWTQQSLGGVVAAGGTLNLKPSQSGSTILLNTASGSVVTLPAPVVGLKFTFIVSASVTSNNHKVITDAGTTFMFGAVATMEASGSTNLAALGNGTSHISILMNGTTTGGLLGSRFTLECISATLWEVSGINAGSGTLATLFSTS